MNEVLLKVEKLYISSQESLLVENVNFELRRGETLGIVGESGSGKSLTSLALMGLLPPELKKKGKATLSGTELLQLSEADFAQWRGRRIAMIFQEPMTALNPSMRCGKQVGEVLKLHTRLKKRQRKERVVELFREVELPRPQSMLRSYPHELSGGQKQRVMIAMALAGKPDLLIADEPTTALDVSVQAGILRLLKKLQQDYGMAMLFISHDLGVVARLANQILVLYQGKVKELGPAREVFESPQHPYTKGLLACRPTRDTYDRRLPLVRNFLDESTTARDVISPAVKEARSLRRMKQSPLFRMDQIQKTYGGTRRLFGKTASVKALQGVSLDIYPGESMGLVGESGSGKSTLGRIVVGLEKANGGQIWYGKRDIALARRSQWRRLNRDIQIIFQDPFSALNPKLKIGEALAEVLRLRQNYSPKKARQEAGSLLEKVGLLPEYYKRYPHEFSGGQRQRIGIARALAVQPKFIVCDEAVSALDVSVQAQILNLLNDLKDEYGFTYLFIAHDLNVVKYFCDRVAVLQDGKLVEQGMAETLYREPKMEYTRQLMAEPE